MPSYSIEVDENKKRVYLFGQQVRSLQQIQKLLRKDGRSDTDIEKDMESIQSIHMINSLPKRTVVETIKQMTTVQGASKELKTLIRRAKAYLLEDQQWKILLTVGLVITGEVLLGINQIKQDSISREKEKRESMFVTGIINNPNSATCEQLKKAIELEHAWTENGFTPVKSGKGFGIVAHSIKHGNKDLESRLISISKEKSCEQLLRDK